MADPFLAQEEVWDDSDLLKSWNEAFAEYKKYHSIAAKGGKVETPPAPPKDGLANGEKPANATADEQPKDETADSDDYDPSVGQASKSDQESACFASAAAAALPQALAASVHDDAMKNIMMSWYYAGYYTGLYEGKQIGYASAIQQQQEQPQQQERG